MWFTGIIFEILFSFYTLNAFLVEKPHRHSVYAVFPYPNKFYGRNKIPAVLLISGFGNFYWVFSEWYHSYNFTVRKRTYGTNYVWTVIRTRNDFIRQRGTSICQQTFFCNEPPNRSLRIYPKEYHAGNYILCPLRLLWKAVYSKYCRYRTGRENLSGEQLDQEKFS